MPTYGYKCKSCAYEFEELQRITDEPLVQCPSCKKETLVRIIGGGAGLVFKGSGFYLTDYKKPSKDDAKKPPTKKEMKTETKPESKPESKPSDSSTSKSSGDSTTSTKE